MEWVETTGKTVEEAKDRALDELGVDDADAEFEIVDDAKAGLFGLVRKEARVRARVRPTQPRPKVERRRTRRRDGGGRSSDGGGDRTPRPAATGSQAADGTGASEGGGRRRRSRGGQRDRTSSGSGRSAADAGNGSGGERPGGDDRRQGRDRVTSRKEEDMDEVTLEQQVEVMEDFLDGLVEAFGLEGQISSQNVDDDTVEIHIDGGDLGLLIGPKGQTLAAVQELARTVAQRKLAGPHQGRVRLDIASYRKRRAEALTRFALQVAEDVKSTGTAKVLEPMSPADRKVVHDALTDVDGVRTASEGEDQRRRVVVLPA